MGTVMGVEKKIAKKDRLEIDPKVKSWDQLSRKEQHALMVESTKLTRINKRKLSR
jgi:hypothetical protein